MLFFRSIGVGGDDSDSCSVLHHYVEVYDHLCLKSMV